LAETLTSTVNLAPQLRKTSYNNPADAKDVAIAIFFDLPQFWKASISSPNCEIDGSLGARHECSGEDEWAKINGRR
jgi:hypothetical protein